MVPDTRLSSKPTISREDSPLGCLHLALVHALKPCSYQSWYMDLNQDTSHNDKSTWERKFSPPQTEDANEPTTSHSNKSTTRRNRLQPKANPKSNFMLVNLRSLTETRWRHGLYTMLSCSMSSLSGQVDYLASCWKLLVRKELCRQDNWWRLFSAAMRSHRTGRRASSWTSIEARWGPWPWQLLQS